jgi:hypothetical protein
MNPLNHICRLAVSSEYLDTESFDAFYRGRVMREPGLTDKQFDRQCEKAYEYLFDYMNARNHLEALKRAAKNLPESPDDSDLRKLCSSMRLTTGGKPSETLKAEFDKFEIEIPDLTRPDEGDIGETDGLSDGNPDGGADLLDDSISSPPTDEEVRDSLGGVLITSVGKIRYSET